MDKAGGGIVTLAVPEEEIRKGSQGLSYLAVSLPGDSLGDGIRGVFPSLDPKIGKKNPLRALEKPKLYIVPAARKTNPHGDLEIASVLKVRLSGVTQAESQLLANAPEGAAFPSV